ncbi:MAG: porin [Burkholderiaceae bacterium]|uniref:porin n=1 Tax=Herminiimonas sp. Marseille-P9896 TaxID=2742211 RepID=UPI001589E09F|nr:MULTISPECIES: porin [Oxalobacteraceae]MBX9800204.1 porin [Burkholderiaceae bacterium]
MYPIKYKKIYLAVAIASAFAAPAMAQSSVQVTGLVDNYVGSMKYSGDNGRSSVVNSGGMTTSWFGFKGTEDLGGGLKAKFNLTSFFRADTGASGRFNGNETFFSRDANVGLVGSFGAISLGRDLAPNFLPSILFNPYGDSFQLSPLILHMDVPWFNASGWTNSVAGDTGWSNEIIYTTPDIGGLKANFHYQFGEVAGKTGKNNAGANLLYFNGPLALTAYYQKVQVNNPLEQSQNNVQPATNIPFASGMKAARQTSWFVGGSYDFTVAKLFATYNQSSHDIDLKDRTVQLGTSIPLGQGSILASWANTKRDGTVVGMDLKRNTASFGYDYNLSKRTDVYAVYMYDKITQQTTGNSVALGIRHRF